jgi:hypothetical protein
VFVYGEHTSTMSVSSVKYGGQLMTPIIQKTIGSTTNSYTGAYILNEAGIAVAKDGNISVTWGITPSGGKEVISAFFINVNQATLTGSKASGGSTNATTVSTSALSNTAGSLVLVAATAAYNGSNYVLNNGFIKGPAEQNTAWGDIVAGYKPAIGINEMPSVSMYSSMRQSIIGFVLNNRITSMAGLEARREISELHEPRVYPNPVPDQSFTIDFGRQVKTGSVQLYDLSGRLIIRKMIQNDTRLKILLKRSAKGVYLLDIHTDHNQFTRKQILID